jgi:nicotinamidase/pyrazinamidase
LPAAGEDGTAVARLRQPGRRHAGGTPTGLAGYLRERGLARVFLVGLALDFCVRYSAEDAHRCGFATVVIDDACRAIDVGGSLAAARQAFSHLAIVCAPTASIR